MAYYGAKQLGDSLRTVRKTTLRIAEEIPEAQYSFKPTPETRSVAQLLTHIALSYRFQKRVHATERRTTLAGMDFPALMQGMAAEEAEQRTKAEIIELLKRDGEGWASWVEALPEDFLGELVEMPMSPPSSKSRFEMLLSTKEHEMHHRGQLMLIQRLLGMVPPLTRDRQAQASHAPAGRT